MDLDLEQMFVQQLTILGSGLVNPFPPFAQNNKQFLGDVIPM